MAEMPETRFTRAGDVDVAYQVVGSGAQRDLVFVPGWVSHLEVMWELPEFARFLDRLAAMGRLILFDKRGTGLSDRVAGHLRSEPAGEPPQRGTRGSCLCRPGPGVRRRGSCRLEPSGRASRHCAGPDQANRRTLARARSGLSPGQPRQGAYLPRRGAIRAGIRLWHGAQPRPSPRLGPRD